MAEGVKTEIFLLNLVSGHLNLPSLLSFESQIVSEFF